jgi:mercuric ion transport protein
MEQSAQEVAIPEAPEAAEHASAGVKAGLVGGVLAALVSVVCWVVPLVLVSIGLTGAWMSTFTVLAPYKWVLIGIALASLGYAGYKIFRVKPAEGCEPDPACAAPQGNRLPRVMFWIVSALVLVAIVSPYLVPLFFEE